MPKLIIDTHCVRHNVNVLRNRIGPTTRLMLVIKANAYGLGAAELLPHLDPHPVDMLGVSRIHEAVELAPLTDRPILILKNTAPIEIQSVHHQHVQFTVSSMDNLRDVIRFASGQERPVSIHLKFNTGMNRQGLHPSDAVEAITLLSGQSQVKLDGIYTHFSSADAESGDETTRQLNVFNPVINLFRDRYPEIIVHAANSAATVRFPESHLDMVRCGIAAYGYLPMQLADHDAGLKPALSLHTPIIQVISVMAGDTIGYGRTHTFERPTRVATLAIGYADGYHLTQSNRGHVLVNGVSCPIVGRISMDQTSVDIGKLDVKMGDMVVLMGTSGDAEISLYDVARDSDCIPYEVMTSIGSRVRRVYKSGN